MPISAQELIKQAKQSVEEITVQELFSHQNKYNIIDIREENEINQGMISSAHHISRSFLEMKINEIDHTKPTVLYCASGNRSVLAAKNLQVDLGYQNILSLEGGYTEWKNQGYDIEKPFLLTEDQLERYSRHILINEIGKEGQRKLLTSKVLVVGAGGLGSPALLYLAAAGIGTIGIVDDDQVELSNLQRQIIHTTESIGQNKVDSAKITLEKLNPGIKIVTHNVRLYADNIIDIMSGYDVVIDGVDNFPTRYLLNDAATRLKIPVVSSAILGFESQTTVYDASKGPCYTCVFPSPPPAELAPTCGVGGVLGVMPGTTGLLQATEAIKLITGQGEPLIGRMLMYDALQTEFWGLKTHKDPNCPICSSPKPLDAEFPDYQEFCSI